MVASHDFSMRDDMPADEIARRKLEGLATFPLPNYYEPLCFGSPAAGQGGLDFLEGGRLDLNALVARSKTGSPGANGGPRMLADKLCNEGAH
eukprot:10242439-Alexandrium_andersonii.AAC.1